MKASILTVFSVVLLGVGASAQAADRLVPSEYPTIQAAVNAAQSGDTVVVSPGTHAGSIEINGKSLTLVGAGATSTAVDGQFASRLLTISNVPSPGVVVRDLTFQKGATGDDGAGIRVLNSRVTLTRCKVVDCLASRDVGCAWCNPVSLLGGGVYIGTGSHVTLLDSEVARNRVRQSFFAWGAGGEIRGAGIYAVGALVELVRVECRQNQLIGNDYPPPANNNDIRGFGAGICAVNGSVLSLVDTVIEANEIFGDRCDAGHGAGVYCGSSSLSMTRASIVANVSRTPHGVNQGAGVWFSGGSGNFVDSRVWLNFASSSAMAEPGSGVYAGSDGLAIGQTDFCGSGAQPIWGSWTDLGGVTTSNFCIDCNSNGILDTIEVASGQAADVNESGIPDECECLGDITGDGRVDAVDLAVVLVHWGTSGKGQFNADVNSDGIVDAFDLTYVLNQWGLCS